jgi:hypothetical protein
MPCNCNKQKTTASAITNKQENDLVMMDLKRPSIPSLTTEQKTEIILFIVGDSRSCAEGNRYVDYIIRWLIEDGIRYEKYDVNHPYAKKYCITKTPSVILKKLGLVVQWHGIALTYKEIITLLSQ